MARPSALVWRLEEHAETLLSLARCWRLGEATRADHRGAGFRVVDDRRESLQSSPTRCGRSWRQSSDEPLKRGLNSKIHLAVDAHGMPVRIVITDGTSADCTKARELIEGIKAECLIADKAYDTDAIVEQARAAQMQVVIPPKKNRIEQREFDQHIYKLRHLVENAFMRIKAWRGIATRYAKNAASFMAAVQIRCLVLWLKIS